MASSKWNYLIDFLTHHHWGICCQLLFSMAILDWSDSFWFMGLTGHFGIWLIPKIRHHIWRYEVFENEIEIQHGLIRVTRVIVPMVRVQHVDTSQGPLLRHYRLASVQISTAATVHDIPALELEEADELRDYISRLARVTEDDV